MPKTNTDLKTNALRLLDQAGVRGLQILIAPDDLICLTTAALADLIRSAAQEQNTA